MKKLYVFFGRLQQHYTRGSFTDYWTERDDRARTHTRRTTTSRRSLNLCCKSYTNNSWPRRGPSATRGMYASRWCLPQSKPFWARCYGFMLHARLSEGCSPARVRAPRRRAVPHWKVVVALLRTWADNLCTCVTLLLLFSGCCRLWDVGIYHGVSLIASLSQGFVWKQ